MYAFQNPTNAMSNTQSTPGHFRFYGLVLGKFVSMGPLYSLQLLCKEIQDEMVQNTLSFGLDSQSTYVDLFCPFKQNIQEETQGKIGIR